MKSVRPRRWVLGPDDRVVWPWRPLLLLVTLSGRLYNQRCYFGKVGRAHGRTKARSKAPSQRIVKFERSSWDADPTSQGVFVRDQVLID